MVVRTDNEFILQTKLHRPQVTADLICRERLHQKMDAGLEMPVSLVSAPAGYGKSMLLSHWAESLDRECAWVSLDQDDNDIHLFLRYLIAALRTIFPDCCERSESSLKSLTPPPVKTIVRFLINEINELDSQFVLVLDDYHRTTNKDVHKAIRIFVEHPVTNMHLVIATRRDPPLPLAALSGLGKINQIRLENLEFTLQEASELINQSRSKPVSESAVANAHASVEGWAVGLRLVLLALSSKEDAEIFLLGLGRGFNPMQQFLFSEVLSGLDPSLKEWLMKVSILDRYCASLCESVCGTSEEKDSNSTQGQAFIDLLVRHNLFCLPLDNDGKWFRFHHQFQALLRDGLVKVVSKDETNSLYQRASLWFEQQSLIDEAIKYSIVIHDQARAALLVKRYGGKLIAQERCHRMEAWLNHLDQQTIQDDPTLLVLAAWTHYFRLQMSDWKISLDQAQARIDEMNVEPVERDKQLGLLGAMRSSYLYMNSDLDGAIESAKQAVDKVPSEYERLRIHAFVALGLSYQASGRHEEMRDFLEDTVTALGGQEPEFQVLILSLLCTICWLECRFTQMRPHVFKLLKISRDSEVFQHKAWAGTYHAISAYWKNDLDQVEQILCSSASDANALHVITYQDDTAILVLTHLARNRQREAMKVANRLSDFGLEIGNSSVFDLGEALRAEVAIRSGNLTQAGQWAAGFTEREMRINFACYEPQLTLARILVAQDTDSSRERGLNVLSKIEKHARSTYFRSLLVKVLCLKSILLSRLNRNQDAMQALGEALSEAAPGGGTRFFLDFGQPMAQLLDQIQTDENNFLVRRLLTEFEDEKTHRGREFMGDLMLEHGHDVQMPRESMLTTRELDVLHLLVRRLRNKQIASELFVSDETVKSHLKNIYEKLDVHNRRQAVTKARAMGFLTPGN